MQRGFLSAKALAGDGADCARWAVLRLVRVHMQRLVEDTHTLHYCLLCAWEFRFMKGLEGSASGMHRALASAPLLSGVFSSHLELILDLGNRAKRETDRQTDRQMGGACIPGTSRT